MAVYETETEQLEHIRKWWKENSKALVGGVVLGLALLIAIWAWRNHTQTQGEAASAEYQMLIGEVDKGDAKAGLIRAARIRNEFADTPYALFAAMAMAKLELDKGNKKAAQQHLEWALKNADEASLQHIARLRLARVMLDNGQGKEALALLNKQQPGDFLAAYEEVKGDIYRKLAQLNEASLAYQRALKALEPEVNPEKKALLQMKLDDLGVTARVQEKAA